MVITKFHLLLLITIFNVSHCERRIVDGEEVTSEKSYVVYLIKAPISDRTYDSWLCGGALVSKEFIITSAACVEDVHYMYAIAGYRIYVNDKNLERNDCTRQMKKKIVYTCVPVSYEFDFDQIEKWAYIDIALVKVESPYDFDDARFQLMCSYVPSIIPVNYDLKRQATNVDAMVLGWGHTEYWRQRGDFVNYNQDYLRFGSTTLFDKKKCQQEYTDYPDLTKIIEKYMICSMEPGHLNDHGVPYSMNQKPGRAGCITQKQKSMGLQGVLCKVELTSEQPEQILMNHLMHDEDETRKHMNSNEKSNNKTNIVNGTRIVKGTDNDNGTNVVNGIGITNRTDNNNRSNIVNGLANGTDIANGTDMVNRTDSFDGTDFIYKPGLGNISGYFNRTFTRRNGICQNDHGGPLVTWVGKREVLIGVASVFKITEKNKCIGPFLYTSTMCNGAFIGCVLGDRRANILRGKNTSVSTSEALLCDSPPNVKGFDTIESYVSWKDHPDGPADNEKNMRGRLVPNLKKDRYATNVKEDSEEDVSPLSDINSQHKIYPNFRPKKVKQEINDRFSLRIGPPPGVRPPPGKRHLLRKIPPPKREPPPNVGTPQEMTPPPMNKPPPDLAPQPNTRLLPEFEPQPIIRPPLETVPPPIIRRLPKTGPSPIIRPPRVMGPSTIIRYQPKMGPPSKIRPPAQIEPPAFDEILNFKRDEVFVKKTFESKPSPKVSQPSSVVQPEILIRPQSSFRG